MATEKVKETVVVEPPPAFVLMTQEVKISVGRQFLTLEKGACVDNPVVIRTIMQMFKPEHWPFRAMTEREYRLRMA